MSVFKVTEKSQEFLYWKERLEIYKEPVLHKIEKSSVDLFGCLCNIKDINIEMKNAYEETPLYVACQLGNKPVVEILLSKRANVKATVETGETPLYVACQNGRETVVEILLSNGANINEITETGATPLHVACQNGHKLVVEILLSNGANINTPKLTGETPLYIAYQNRANTVGKKVKIADEIIVLLKKAAREKAKRAILEMICITKSDLPKELRGLIAQTIFLISLEI